MTDTDLTPRGPLEYRRAQTLDVRFADRIIEVIAVPYDAEAPVPVAGRMILESIAPGAFDGVERRANRIKVNRDHDVRLTCGRVVALHPSRVEGLVGELKIGRSPLGDETLEYAADGILDASIGFAPFPGHEHWTEQRSKRRITKAYLGHIAMVPEPAYESANVLAVRERATSAAPAVATPNLDALRWAELERQLDSYRPSVVD